MSRPAGTACAVLAATAVLLAWPPTPQVRCRPGGRAPEPSWRRVPASLIRWLARAQGLLLGERRGGLDDEQVAALATALAAELRAGRPAVDALDRACSAGSLSSRARTRLLQVVRQGQLGGDLVDPLRRLPARGPAVGWLAAAWDLAEHHGGAPAVVLDRVAAAAQARARHRQQVAAQLAAPRATARLLAGLPLVGLLMGQALGSEPLDWLLGSTPGRLCLALGVGLEAAGLLWVRSLASRATAAT